MKRCAAALVAMLSVGSARADQTDPRLDALFAELKAAPDAATAHVIESRIWAIWMQTGSADATAALAEGVERLGQGDFPAALQAFDRVVTIAPGFAEGWNKRATVLYLLGRYADSVADIDRVLALEPRHFGALSGLGMCDIQLDRDRAALSAMERAAALDPNMPGMRTNIDALRQKIARESI